MNCNWSNNNGTHKCDRNAYGDSEFCLYHKPNKTKEDSILFWRIINFKNSSQRLIDLQSELYKGGGFNYPVSHIMGDEIIKIQDSNFTPDEKASADYIQFKESIVNIYHESKISGRGSMVQPDFYGFIFPNSDTFDYQFKYDYNPWTDGSLNFKECIFEGFMNFSGFTFLGQTSFENCDFKGGVIFTNSTFNKSVNFIQCFVKLNVNQLNIKKINLILFV